MEGGLRDVTRWAKRQVKQIKDQQQERGEGPGQRAAEGKLVVTCERAEGLPKMDKYTQRADPYLVVSVAACSRVHSPQQTAVCKNTLKPVWNEKLRFECVSGDSEVRVEMFDHEKMGKDRSMGSFSIPVAAISGHAATATVTKAFQLTGSLFDKRPAAGAVYLSLSFTPVAPAPTPAPPAAVQERGELDLPGERQGEVAAPSSAPPAPPSLPCHSTTKEEEMYIEAITKQEKASNASPSDVTDISATGDWAAVHAELLQVRV